MFVEEWVTTLKKFGNDFEIFVNPEPGELKDLVKKEGTKEIRYIIDFEEGKVYVFTVDLLHPNGAAAIGTRLIKAYNKRDYKNFYFGTGKVRGSKINIEQFDYDFFKKNKRFDGVKKYFTGSYY